VGTVRRSRKPEGRGGQDHHRGQSRREHRGRRLSGRLLVDLDPQCNAYGCTWAAEGRRGSVYDCLSGELTLTAAAVPERHRRLDVVPSTPDLAGANVELPRIEGSETTLRDRLGSVRDALPLHAARLPAVARPLTVNALGRGRQGHRPVQTEYFALEGLAQLLDTLSLIQRELNPRCPCSG
jgi:chromosome partitioning protein